MRLKTEVTQPFQLPVSVRPSRVRGSARTLTGLECQNIQERVNRCRGEASFYTRTPTCTRMHHRPMSECRTSS